MEEEGGVADVIMAAIDGAGGHVIDHLRDEVCAEPPYRNGPCLIAERLEGQNRKDPLLLKKCKQKSSNRHDFVATVQ